ncbi:MAG: NAD(P)/FAD-dependent oxidoreductase [Candidatus Binataceae bacterium]
MRSSRIVIIGAGVNGCSIAFHLARAGADVVVIDKGAVGAAMTARSGALVRTHYTFPAEAELAWKSLHYFQNWAEVVGGDCGFVPTGLAVVVDDTNVERLRSNVGMLRSLGIDTETVTRAELLKLQPHLYVDDVAMAAYEPQSGYADPLATTRSLADAARRHGARFELGAAVASIDVGGGRATGVIDESGRRHDGGAVCVVAGPWTDKLLAPLGVQIGIRAERAQIAFFRRPAGLRHPVVIDLIAGGYLRPHGSDLTLVGLGAWKRAPDADPDAYQESNDDDFIDVVRERLGKRIPEMAAAHYERGHAGIYDVSPDQRAVLGAARDIAGLYLAAGFSGTGFKTAPAVGASMAELILDGKSRTVDLTPFRPERFAQGRPIRGAHEYVMAAGFGHTL